VRVLIVDDEPAARERLARLLEEIDPAIEIVGEAGDGLTALDLARTRRPDVILLDVAMREVDGFDVARHLAEPRPLVIFQTAHQHFAVKAFEHDAIDYVLKPVRKARLVDAMGRARRRLAVAAPRWDRAALAEAGLAFGYAPQVPERLLVRHGAGHRLVPVNDIVRFAAADGIVYAHVEGLTPITDYALVELETRLHPLFVRVSRADLVNVAAVQAVSSHGDGSLALTLRDGTVVRVSRRRAAEVKGRIS
jgi:DNA-binding LytR/AlgR family response regulator